MMDTELHRLELLANMLAPWFAFVISIGLLALGAWTLFQVIRVEVRNRRAAARVSEDFHSFRLAHMRSQNNSSKP